MLRQFSRPATRFARFAALAVAIFTLSASAEAGRPAPPRTPEFAGDALPRPPQAGSEWKPPEGTPAAWVEAVERMLEHGLPDPRGCEYREVDVVCEWTRLTTHAWLLPRTPTDRPDAPRFAIAWDGLIHPTLRVGAPADWKADAAFVRPAEKGRAPVGWDFVWRTRGPFTSFHESPHPLKSCYALLLGDFALAERAYTPAAEGFAHPNAGDRAARDVDPYLDWASLWADACYDRGIAARFHGDDVIALDDLRTLAQLAESIERDGARRGLAPPSAPVNGRFAYVARHVDPNQLDALVDDLARRVAERPVERVFAPDAAPIRDRERRIAALVRDLETVAITDAEFQAHATLIDPVIAALAAEGPAAVEPLLRCLETDRRLTRSAIGSQRRPSRDHRFIDVASVAAIALRAILDPTESRSGYPVPTLTLDTPEADRRRAAQAIREFFLRTQGGPAPADWFARLADDRADSLDWVAAAENITRRSLDRDSPPDALPGSDAIPRRGESLRGRANPSVAELLARRATSLAQLPGQGGQRMVDARRAAKIALALADWSPATAAPVLRLVAGECRAVGQVNDLGVTQVQLWTRAVDAGERACLTDYADWLPSLDPGRASNRRELLRPLARYADDATMIALAEKIFAPDSAWSQHVKRGAKSWAHEGDPTLLRHEAFRRRVFDQLADRTPFATATISASGRLSMIVPDRFELSGEAHRVVEAGEKIEDRECDVRACDYTAWALSHIDGAPLFELHWPVERKDAAIEELRRHALRWRDAYRERPTVPGRRQYERRSEFWLAPLDRPASEAEAAAGRAIFSLAGLGVPTRVVPLAKRPQPARWKTLTRFAYRPISDPYAYPPRPVDPAAPRELVQTGLVWQAEEALVEGEWKRFYGFVGAHAIERVPADEIEFLDALPVEPEW